MNNICMTGRLVKDPELKFVQNSGKAVANFTIAVDNPFKKDETYFFRCVVWGKQAENLANYKHKGDPIGIVGRLTSRSYESNGERKFITEIIVNNVDYLPTNKSNTNIDTSMENILHDEGKQALQNNNAKETDLAALIATF